jgi:hypothetical protein
MLTIVLILTIVQVNRIDIPRILCRNHKLHGEASREMHG